MAKQRKSVTTKKNKTNYTVKRKSNKRRIGSVRKLANGKWRAISKTGRPLSTRVGGKRPKRNQGHSTKANAVNRVARSVGIKK